MSNKNTLLSDEELREKIIFALYAHQIGKTIEKKLPANYLLNLINTQKRLYAEKIVDTSKEIWLTHDKSEFNAGYLKGREDLRAEQTSRIK